MKMHNAPVKGCYAVLGVLTVFMSGCHHDDETTVVQTPPENKVIINNAAPAATPTAVKKVIVVPAPRKEVKIVKENHTTIIEKGTKAPDDMGRAASNTPAASSESNTNINVTTARPKATARPTPSPTRSMMDQTPRPMATQTASQSGPLVVEAEVEQASHVPEPRTVAYKESVTFIKYKVISVERGTLTDQELVAVQWGMKNRKLQPAARLRPGQRQRLTLVPFEDQDTLQSVMQNNDLQDAGLATYWVTNAS